MSSRAEDLGHYIYYVLKKNMEKDFVYNIFLLPTLDQLNEIRKSSIAKMLCDNINGVGNIQRSGFFLEGPNNPKVDCNEILGIDLSVWNEGRKIILKNSKFYGKVVDFAKQPSSVSVANY